MSVVQLMFQGLAKSRRHSQVAGMLSLIGKVLRWLFGWMYYVCLICLVGSLLGVLTHLLYAWFFVESADPWYFAAFGFLNGLKYASVWAGGVSIVICVLRARNEWLASQPSEGVMTQ